MAVRLKLRRKQRFSTTYITSHHSRMPTPPTSPSTATTSTTSTSISTTQQSSISAPRLDQTPSDGFVAVTVLSSAASHAPAPSATLGNSKDLKEFYNRVAKNREQPATSPLSGETQGDTQVPEQEQWFLVSKADGEESG